VQHPHEHHVVHRDLKPTNTLVTEDRVPELLDFGIAKLLPVAGGTSGCETTGRNRLTLGSRSVHWTIPRLVAAGPGGPRKRMKIVEIGQNARWERRDRD
jgi:serine/threonine protein kinase